MNSESEAPWRANREASNPVAAEDASDVERDVTLLRSGGTSLLASERRHLAPLLAHCRRAVHLQCSHGTDTLSLWRLGARDVVGVDVREAMLVTARRKAELLGAPATWHCADVLAPPADLAETADIVYTGKGALPWIPDLGLWARAVTGLLAPGGHLYVFEGHPLNWIWEPERAKLRLRADGDYFARVNEDVPSRLLAHTAPAGQPPLRAPERQWTLGEVVSALAATGVTLLRLEEHPEHFWPQFPDVAPEALRRLPHTFSLLARRGTA